jgi:IS1 family transposase
VILPRADAVEMDELCISKPRNVWLWTAVSRQTSQILAYKVSDRTFDNVAHVRSALPEAYKRRFFYTDGYEAYADRLPASRHRLCQKRDGGTSVVEGVNNSLRHRCSFLVRRHSGPRNLIDSLLLRLDRAVRAHNAACEKRWRRKQAQTTGKTT